MGLPRQSSPAEVRLEQRGFRLLETLCGSCGGAAQHVGKPSSSRDARGRVGVGHHPHRRATGTVRIMPGYINEEQR